MSESFFDTALQSNLQSESPSDLADPAHPLDALDEADVPDQAERRALSTALPGPDHSRSAAAAAVFSALRNRLRARAYRILADRAEAEDVVQEAFLRWLAARDIALHTPAAWLNTVVTRLAIDRLRQQQKGMALPDPEQMALAPDGEGAAEPPSDRTLERRQALAQAIDRLLLRLNRDECLTLLLREGCELEYAELAAHLGLSVEYCRQLLHRARARLQQGTPHGIEDRARRETVGPAILNAIATQDASALISWVDLAYRRPTLTLAGMPQPLGAATSPCVAADVGADLTVSAILAAAVLLARLRADCDARVMPA